MTPRRVACACVSARIAITGASGHLGRLLVRRLLERPEVEELVALDLAPPASTDPRVRAVTADVREAGFARHLRGCDALVHLAFIVERGSRDQALVQAVNVDGTKNVVRAAIEAGVRHIVYASSIGAYGFHADNAGKVLDETAPTRGNDDFYYTRTKAEVERWLDEVEAAQPDVAIARLRPSMFINDGSGRARIMRTPVVLQMGPDEVLTHVTHPEDVAQAFVQALRKRARGAYNIAADEPLLASRWGPATGRRTLRVPAPALRGVERAYGLGLGDVDPVWFRIGSALSIVVSSEKAKRELGWRPVWPTSGAALRQVVGRPTACASRATWLALGGASVASRVPGGMGMGAHVEHESRTISGALNIVLTGEQPSEWRLELHEGRARILPGLVADARASVRMSDETFHDLLSNRLSYTTAQVTGRVRFTGSGELSFTPGLLTARLRALATAEGLRGLPGRAFARLIGVPPQRAERGAPTGAAQDEPRRPERGAS
jgi:UDP-glucose 4-epimerase